MSISRIDEAFAQMAEGNAAAAAEVLGGVLREAPGYAPAYVLYARACEALHAWPQALGVWQQALLLAPSLTVAREGVLRATRVIAALRELDPPAPEAAEPTLPVPSELPATAPRPLPLGRRALDTPPPPAQPSATRPPFPGTEADLDEPTLPPAEDAAPASGLQRLPSDLPPGVFDVPPPPDVFRAAPPVPDVPAPTSGLPAGPRTFDLDLDGLIEQLTTQPRITPRPDLDAIPPPDLEDDGEDMVSETLARIYATQGQFDEAARIYEMLAAQQPERAEAFQREATALRARAGDE